MKDFLVLDSSPCDEDCVQVKSNENYIPAMRQECNRYKELLEKKFAGHLNLVQFKIKSFPHDFGTYYEVVVVFDDENEKATNIAYDIESNLPTTWE